MEKAFNASADFLHGGDLAALANRYAVKPSAILDFSSNINPLGPPEYLRAWISQSIDSLDAYPEPRSESLCKELARFHGLNSAQIVVGNGANDLIYAIARASDAKRLITVEPTFVEYRRAAQTSGIPHHAIFASYQAAETYFPWKELGATLLDGDLVFLGNPNNPTGTLLDLNQLRQLAISYPRVQFAIDESFIEFVEPQGISTQNAPAPHIGSLPLFQSGLSNVIILRSFTKFYAIPGLRLGYAIAALEFVRKIQEQIPDWSVNSIAQAIGRKLLSPGLLDTYAHETRSLVSKNRANLLQQMAQLPGIQVLPAAANFLFCEWKTGNARDLAHRLMQQSAIAIRSCHNYPGTSEGQFRVAVKNQDENQKLVEALQIAIEQTDSKARSRPRKHKCPSIMLQGTGSNAGKTLMTAAFCRILLRQGLRVAPFKSQNMSLNSFVTTRGEEISRAQALQAVACKIEPDSRMNPVLLKPNADTGSHVLLHGKPMGHMRAVEYQKFKASLFAEVKASYDSLANDFDAIVLEGAGSPGEVNLKKNDIVNMNMARYAESPVLIVGDIDRGGVFASFVGTMEVLTKEERALVKGFLVNKFRGDATLLKDALDYTLMHTGRPVLGIVPYLRGLNLPEEDSVSFKSQHQTSEAKKEIQIAIVDLPHISNFTDFDALRLEPDVQVQIVRNHEFPNRPDVIVIPGTRNTIYDLQYLNETGLSNWIDQNAKRGAEIVGLCGGFQMLGGSISDAEQIESNVTLTSGLRLLDVETSFASEKTLKQSTVTHLPSGISVRGYEVHHGQTRIGKARELLAQDKSMGCESADGLVWGTYLHGIFDDDGFRRWFIDRARQRRGLKPLQEIQARYDMDAGLDRLADAVEEAIDLKEIMRIMGL